MTAATSGWTVKSVEHWPEGSGRGRDSAREAAVHKTQVENPVWFPVVKTGAEIEKKNWNKIKCQCIATANGFRFKRGVLLSRVHGGSVCASVWIFHSNPHLEKANGTKSLIIFATATGTSIASTRRPKRTVVVVLFLFFHSCILCFVPFPHTFQYSHRISVSIADRVTRCSGTISMRRIL